ncbi:uncharacterized protein LOC133174962 [Saccostrea echinata]|uniref:uncharacterized protein LOC133174962 n=1 Tax=Saccostrea echinata TaxID=191078 RepID=UPI002A808BF1|nr:uncharacterized protein LOC133174962 [Saccostrea echinata]
MLTEVSLDINKLTAYIGETGLQIRCHADGKSVVRPTWMSIEFAGFQSQRPMVYLFRKDGEDVLEWGEEFNVTRLQSHITATGHLEGSKSFLQLDFSHVMCEDGGRYTCIYAGLDDQGKLRKFSMAGDFVAKAIDGGPPKVTLNGKLVKSFDSIKVSPGDKLHLVCEGDVGKPRIPILWLLNELPKPQRVLGKKDGVKQGLQIIPDDNLCSFRSIVHLYYEMGNSMAILSCKIAFRKVNIFLHP